MQSGPYSLKLQQQCNMLTIKKSQLLVQKQNFAKQNICCRQLGLFISIAVSMLTLVLHFLVLSLTYASSAYFTIAYANISMLLSKHYIVKQLKKIPKGESLHHWYEMTTKCFIWHARQHSITLYVLYKSKNMLLTIYQLMVSLSDTNSIKI